MKTNNAKRIFELGAGHERDTTFFASNELEVEALEYSLPIKAGRDVPLCVIIAFDVSFATFCRNAVIVIVIVIVIALRCRALQITK